MALQLRKDGWFRWAGLPVGGGGAMAIVTSTTTTAVVDSIITAGL